MPFRRSPPNSVRAITWPKPSSRPERSKRPPKTTAQPWRRTRNPPPPNWDGRTRWRTRGTWPMPPRISARPFSSIPAITIRCSNWRSSTKKATSPRPPSPSSASSRRIARWRNTWASCWWPISSTPTPYRSSSGNTKQAQPPKTGWARAAIPSKPNRPKPGGSGGGLPLHRTIRQGAAAARKSRRRRALQLRRAHDLRARPARSEAVRRRRRPVQPGRPAQTGRSQDLDRTRRHALSGPRLRALPGGFRSRPPVGRRYSRDVVPARPHARQFETVEARARSLPALSRTERWQEPRPGIPGAPTGTNPKNRAGEELMRIGFLPAALALLLVPGIVRADLKRAMAEPNLEKRSGLAMENAAAALKAAREAYDKNDSDLTAKDLAEIQESVDLAYDSLVQSGKNPRNSSCSKKAEISTRDLSRRLESFQEQMSYSDRPMLDKVKADVQKVHDDLLMGVMEGRKKKK